MRRQAVYLARPYTPINPLISVSLRMVHVLIATAVACVLCLVVYRLAKPLKRALQWLIATVLLFGSLALAVP